jgi:hypothetical protein
MLGSTVVCRVAIQPTTPGKVKPQAFRSPKFHNKKNFLEFSVDNPQVWVQQDGAFFVSDCMVVSREPEIWFDFDDSQWIKKLDDDRVFHRFCRKPNSRKRINQ